MCTTPPSGFKRTTGKLPEKMGKKLGWSECRSFASGLIVGCLLVSMTYFTMFRNDMELFSDFLKSSAWPSSAAAPANQSVALLVPRLSEKTDRMAVKGKRQALCDLSAYRTDVCDIHGDVRIVGNDSSTVLVVSSAGDNQSFEIKPYPRKADRVVVRKVPTVHVRSLTPAGDAPPSCGVTHAVPGVVFATAGYCGNIFHDISDLLLPLFQTTRRFRGRVQLLAVKNQRWWLYKYRHILAKLSDFPVINYDDDDRVHCFRHAIVGLRADSDLTIDASKSAEGVTMVDFVAFLRGAYSLQHARPSGGRGRRPRLLFISRGGSRRFVNLDEVVPVAEEVGFEVVSAEPNFMDVAAFAETVNSCDVMVGVHGAGLTNMVFLPTGAVLIQVVPLAKLDWIAANYYAKPAMGMQLKYLQYDILEEESTLIDHYPRDHAVFKDPAAIHKQGWQAMGKIYLVQQNVRLRKDRFRGVLEQAMELLEKDRQ
ncbi:alpha-1,3-arabinosyltransferase XAT3-like [Curcuma longa]|uniref:alpha-1,3-arabinosyltransferase XAT3-like n=1 Tax=Curcuma longa TaxID=136217 RepID=UPI003D9E0152